MISVYTSEAAAISNLGAQAPLGGVSYAAYVTEAQRLLDGGTPAQAVANQIASNFGVFLAIYDAPDEGDVIDLVAQVGATSTGEDNQMQVDGGANGTVTFGWSYAARPAEPTDTQIGAMVLAIAGTQQTAERRDKLRQLASLLAGASIASDLTPRSEQSIIDDGEDWYDDPGSVSTDLAAAFAAAQAGGLIP